MEVVSGHDKIMSPIVALKPRNADSVNVARRRKRGAVRIDQSVVFGRSGLPHAVRVRPVDASKPLKVALAWTDALGPGPGGEVPAWVNDLDLTVVDPSSRTYRGNVRQD